jgi:hypothetical protein
VKSEQAVLDMTDALNALDIPWMLTGSLATNVYGVPRSTADADFVVELGQTALSALMNRLGDAYRLDSQLSFETITATSRFIVTLPSSVFRIELFLLSDDPHDQSRFSRRVRQDQGGRQVFLPTAEDVIITKLRWSQRGRRPKDLEDVRSVIEVQQARLDWPYVESWCDRHGTRDLLESIRQSLPPDLRP